MMRIKILVLLFVGVILLGGMNVVYGASTAKKKLIFSIDQGFANGMVVNKDTNALQGIIDSVQPLREHYDVYLLLNPMVKREALYHMLDYMHGKIPFVLDVLSSDTYTLGHLNEPYNRETLQSISVEEMVELKARYGEYFAGIRFFELIGQDCIRQDKVGTNPNILKQYLQFAKDNGMFVQWGDFYWGGESCYYQDDFNPLLREYSDILTVVYSNNGIYRLANGIGMVKGYSLAYGVEWGLSNQSWFWSEKTGQSERAIPPSVVSRFIAKYFAEGATMIQFESSWAFFKLAPGDMKYNNYRSFMPTGEGTYLFEMVRDVLIALAKVELSTSSLPEVAIYLPNIVERSWLGGSLVYRTFYEAYEVESLSDKGEQNRLYELAFAQNFRVHIPLLPYDVDKSVAEQFKVVIIPSGMNNTASFLVKDPEFMYEKLLELSEVTNLFIESTQILASLKGGEVSFIKDGKLDRLTGIEFKPWQPLQYQNSLDLWVVDSGDLGLDVGLRFPFSKGINVIPASNKGALCLMEDRTKGIPFLWEYKNEAGNYAWSFNHIGYAEGHKAIVAALERVLRDEYLPKMKDIWIYPFILHSRAPLHIQIEAGRTYMLIEFYDDTEAELYSPRIEVLTLDDTVFELRYGAILIAID